MIKENKIEWINMGLIPLCLVLSYLIPFRLLMYSYAILGPLHYLTEINWLNDKQYFSQGKKNTLWIIGSLGLILSIPHFFDFPVIKEWVNEHEQLTAILRSYKEFGDVLIFACLLLGIVMVFSPNKKLYWITGILGLLLGWGLDQVDNFHLIFGVFLPTIVHVYLFTAIFMLFGWLKGKSKVGLVTILLHIAIPVFIILNPMDYTTYSIPYDVQELFHFSFKSTNTEFLKILGMDKGEYSTNVYYKAQVFISYAYIYHYLNWFSKTSIIGWGKALTSKKAILILAISGGAIGAYFYNYILGLRILFFLSMLHVLLEFPLNVQSFKGVIQAIPLGKKAR